MADRLQTAYARGRVFYSAEIAETICDPLINGESLPLVPIPRYRPKPRCGAGLRAIRIFVTFDAGHRRR